MKNSSVYGDSRQAITNLYCTAPSYNMNLTFCLKDENDVCCHGHQEGDNQSRESHCETSADSVSRTLRPIATALTVGLSILNK